MEMHKFGTKTNAVSFNQTLARNAGKNKKRTKKTGASPFSKNQFLETFKNLCRKVILEFLWIFK